MNSHKLVYSVHYAHRRTTLPAAREAYALQKKPLLMEDNMSNRSTLPRPACGPNASTKVLALIQTATRIWTSTQRWPAHTVSSTARRSRVISTSSPTAMTPRCDVTCARRSALVTTSHAVPARPCTVPALVVGPAGVAPYSRERVLCSKLHAGFVLNTGCKRRLGSARPYPHASPSATQGALLLRAPAHGCFREP